MERVAGKRGKQPAEQVAMGTLNDYAKPHFPVPPKAFDYSSDVKSYPMALNDKLGDCTLAGVIHMLQLAYAEVGEIFQYPGDQAVQDTYFALTGGADAGLVEHQVLQTWMRDGLFNNKISAYAPVDIRNRQEMTAACFAFGTLYLGVEMPASAEQQFEAHQPWHINGVPETPQGGHCVIATGANNLGLDIITWGDTESMTWEWWEHYGSEAWVVIPEIFVEADHGPVWDIDILALQKDLESL